MAGKAVGVARVVRGIVRRRYGAEANAIQYEQSEEHNRGGGQPVSNGPNPDV